MNNRLVKIDEIRGFTLISMILFHFFWDLNNVSGIKMDWYKGLPGVIWQQSICISFIFISGFCFNLGKHHIKRSLIVFAAGALVTIVTLVFMPENRVIFGVLTFIGSAGLIMIVVEKIHIRLEDILDRFTLNLTMMLGNILLFIVFYKINYRLLILFDRIVELPRYMFKGYFATYIGFCDPTFFSEDYFSIIPWMFLYMAGYYLFRVMKEKNVLKIFEGKATFISVIGIKTLIIYLLHQPVLFGLAYLIYLCRR